MSCTIPSLIGKPILEIFQCCALYVFKTLFLLREFPNLPSFLTVLNQQPAAAGITSDFLSSLRVEKR